MQTPIEAVNYLSCAKAGPHEDQKLNLVCLETSCLQNLACCCACIEMEHKKHVTKPLKFVINQARKQSGTSKIKMNIDILLDIVASQRKNSFEQFQKHRRDIISSLGNIELALQGYYNSIVEQIIVKNTDGNLLIQEAIERASNAKSLEELKFTLKKLVAAIPNQSQSQHSNLSEADLIASLESSSQDIRKSINLSMEEANKRLSEYQANILQLINNLKIWNPPRYKFTEETKHPDIKLISENTVKAYKNSGYKFAIMEPGVESGKSSKKFAFKIKESSSNWLAIGVCHKKVIQSKAYGFVFGSVGHGAYMISSNGGSWSHLRADQNNTIKAFKFTKGDVVQVTLHSDQKKVVFSLDSQTYQLPFEPISSDELHPCILFYYVNDEIEYLPHFKL